MTKPCVDINVLCYIENKLKRKIIFSYQMLNVTIINIIMVRVSNHILLIYHRERDKLMSKKTNIETNRELVAINTNITKIAASEKVTRKVLQELTVQLLTYVPLSNDIDAVNRLIGILTPMNTRLARLFFKAHLEWRLNDETGLFETKLKGDKKIINIATARQTFLDSGQTIWEWSDENLGVEPKPKDFVNIITKNVKKGLAEGEDSISPVQVMQAVFAGGVTLDEILDVVQTLNKDDKE